MKKNPFGGVAITYNNVIVRVVSLLKPETVILLLGRIKKHNENAQLDEDVAEMEGFDI